MPQASTAQVTVEGPAGLKLEGQGYISYVAIVLLAGIVGLYIYAKYLHTPLKRRVRRKR